ncbi:FAD-binding oxidoreductase [Maricurvus nonylphenolicus]|uniref:FAD-binding oxidoreductase n=1 Tax=Maricurvus nonylphenolicus TaxID=1008307 RepID=UPI0036F232BF
MSIITPPGVTQEDFIAAIGELKTVLPVDSVIVENAEHVRSYRDPWGTLPDEVLPSAAVAPRSVEQVQAVLAVARKYRIPLWTISTGRNLAYGGSGPRKAGYIILDLKRMNRILEVNEKHGYAVVEPGVSYFDLYNYLQAKGIKLWIDCAAPGWGGVMGNALDHGGGYTPYGDHFLMQCGMQTVLADGTVIETAMGSVPNSETAQLHKFGCGPSVDGLFSMGNAGVVTKMGIWLMPEPPAVKPFKISFQKEDDLAPIMDISKPLKINMVVPNGTPAVGLIYETGHATTRAKYYSGKGPMPDSAMRKLASDFDVGMWNFYGGLYGPPAIIDNNWDDVRDAYSQIPGAKFYFEEDRPNDAAFEYRAKLMRGIPNMAEFGVLNWVGSGAHLDFTPMSPIDGKDALSQFYMIRDRLAQYDMDYCGEFMVAWRSMAHVNFLLYDVNDAVAKARAHECMGLLIDDAAAKGYCEYRTAPQFMDKVAQTYSWNDSALWKMHDKIKDALDPRGILSPGKSGIWPEHMRGGKSS